MLLVDTGVTVHYCAAPDYWAVPDLLNVSVATACRAVESGSLRVLRIGTGGGASRLPGSAIAGYVQVCEQAAGRAPA
jgi:hypothetical protein